MLPFLKHAICMACALLLLGSAAHATTVVNVGEIREFNGPDDLDFDPNRVVLAVDVFGDFDRTVNGILFKADRPGNGTVSDNGVTGITSASNSIWNESNRRARRSRSYCANRTRRAMATDVNDGINVTTARCLQPDEA